METKIRDSIEFYYENIDCPARLPEATEIRKCIGLVFKMLNNGDIRVAEKNAGGEWTVNSWIKKAILLAFKFMDSKKMEHDSFDKLDLLKFDYAASRYRKVPFSAIRDGVYVGNNAVIMPSCINVGAYIGDNTMVDMNAVIGSCAQIGCNCHIAGLACVGGVLEPASARPVIIEDNCFIGVHSSVLEGVIVRENSIIAAGTTVTASTKIIDRKTGTVSFGEIPKNSVVVSGSYPSGHINISCCVILKSIDQSSAKKTEITAVLRD
jgi:2,3,4,5-tetrahydropyridine-2-carboxylate N-succinyltransferase